MAVRKRQGNDSKKPLPGSFSKHYHYDQHTVQTGGLWPYAIKVPPCSISFYEPR